jgi:cobalt/nickel transport system permease protein
MHMADALISPSVGATFAALSGGAIIYSARKLKEGANDRIIPLMGVMGAFVFAAQMINFTIPGTGSSGHLGGGMILAILLGPYGGFLTLASVLIVQALFFGDGGLLALGCNIFDMAFWTCFVAYPLIYRRIVRQDSRPATMTLGILGAVLVAIQLGAFSVVIQTLLSGISDLPFTSFVLLMQPIHLAIGLVEGLVTAAFIAFVRKARPEILEAAAASKPIAQVPIRKVLVGLGVVALLTGGILSWFASTHPDGLEWSIERITAETEISEPVDGVIPLLGAIQEKTAIFPDYEFKNTKSLEKEERQIGRAQIDQTASMVSPGTTVAGVVGSMMTLVLACFIGFVMKRRKSKAR